MGRIRNAADGVAAASAEVDNTAAWAGVVLEKINKIIDAVQANKSVDLEISIPLGDNIAKLFGREHLTIDGKIPVIQATIKVKLPETA